MDLKQKAARAIGWAGIEGWGRQLLSFLLYAGLARLVGPESFGVVALASIYLAFVQIFVNQGFNTAVIQRKEVEREHLDVAFWLSLVVAVLLCLGTILCSNLLATFFKEPRVAPVLRWLSLLLPIFAFSSIPSAILARDLEFRALAIRSLFASGSGGAIGLVMALAGFDVWSLVAQQLVAASVGLVCLWRLTSWRPRLKLSVRHLRELHRFALNIFGNDVLWCFSQRCDHTFVGYAFGPTALGVYSLANKIIQLLMEAIAGPLEYVALSTFSRLQEQQEQLRNAFYKFTEVGCITSFPVFGGMAFIAPEIVPLAFGEKWLPAVPIIQIIAVYGALRIARTFIHPLMLAKDRSGLYLFFFILNTMGTLIACLIAFHWGPSGIAIAMTVNLIIQASIFLPIYRRVLEISLTRFFQCIISPAISTAVMIFVVDNLKIILPQSMNSIILICIDITSGIIIYCLLISLLRLKIIKEISTIFLQTLPIPSKEKYDESEYVQT